MSYALHAQLAQELDGEKKWGYRKLDTLSISADLSSAKKTARTRRLNESDLFDWLNKDLLTATDVLGSQETTAQVHPEQFTRAIAEQAQKEGLQIVYGTAEHLDRTNEGAYAVTVSPRKDTENDNSPPRVLEFDQIVIAAGPWTGRLLSSLGLGGGEGANSKNANQDSIQARAGRAKSIRGSRAHSIVVRAPEGKTLPAQALFTSIKEQKGNHAEPEIYSKPAGPSIHQAEMIQIGILGETAAADD